MKTALSLQVAVRLLEEVPWLKDASPEKLPELIKKARVKLHAAKDIILRYREDLSIQPQDKDPAVEETRNIICVQIAQVLRKIHLQELCLQEMTSSIKGVSMNTLVSLVTVSEADGQLVVDYDAQVAPQKGELPHVVTKGSDGYMCFSAPDPDSPFRYKFPAGINGEITMVIPVVNGELRYTGEVEWFPR